MSTKRITSRSRRMIAAAYPQAGVDTSWEQRRTNVVRVLAANKPDWMVWVEQNILPGMPIEESTRLMEQLAKAIFLKPYTYCMGRKKTLNLMFNDRYQFTPQGTLPPG